MGDKGWSGVCGTGHKADGERLMAWGEKKE